MIGFAMLLMAPGIGITSVAMIIIGMGCDVSINVAVMLLSEVMDNEKRQKTVVLFQMFTPIAGIVVVGAFYWLKHWRAVFFWCCLIPVLVCLLFSYFFVQETPQFLVKGYEVSQIRQSLHFIAWVNGQE